MWILLSVCRSGVGSGLRGPDCSQQACVTAQGVEGFPVEEAQENTVAGRGARVFAIGMPEHDPQ